MRYERYQSPYLQSAAQVKVDTSFRKSLILLTMDCPLKQVINSRIPAAVDFFNFFFNLPKEFYSICWKLQQIWRFLRAISFAEIYLWRSFSFVLPSLRHLLYQECLSASKRCTPLCSYIHHDGQSFVQFFDSYTSFYRLLRVNLHFSRILQFLICL